MENIKEILDAAGYSLKNIVQSNVYLSSMDLFYEFNKEYAKYFDEEFPARATIGVELNGNALIEVSVVAFKDWSASSLANYKNLPTIKLDQCKTWLHH